VVVFLKLLHHLSRTKIMKAMIMMKAQLIK
jgi:hypothetical protein